MDKTELSDDMKISFLMAVFGLSREAAEREKYKLSLSIELGEEDSS